MPNQDRISEVYKGEIWSPALQQSARDRIDWMCGEVKGRTLDVGCSQGIATILLARRGTSCTGVDTELDRLDYAVHELQLEEQRTAGCATFVGADGARLPFQNETFDTVLLGEVLEHLDQPEVMLADCARVLRPSGRFVITTPFGYHPFHDHKRDFFAAGLIELVDPFAGVVSVDVVDNYIRLVAIKGHKGKAQQLVYEAQSGLEVFATDQQRLLLSTRQSLASERDEKKTLVRLVAANEKALKVLRTHNQRLERRLAHADNRIEAMQTTRWFRLGVAVRHLIHNPLKLPLFLRLVARALLRRRASTGIRLGSTGDTTTVHLPSVQVPTGPVTRPDLTAAVILDTFSSFDFRYEWRQIEPRPDNWRSLLSADRPDVLFVESAWWGNDRSWAGAMSRPNSPTAPLRELVSWCKDEGIPTVFWSKEDPTNFERFIETAKLFDQVFTVDADCISRYREVLGHDRIGLLPFAAQPRIHNPVSIDGGRQYATAFAGTYHAARYPDRRRQIDTILGPAIPFGLHIYSRLAGDPRYEFPPPYAEHIVGTLPYDRVLSAYKAYKVFLNVNSVTESETMCARRVFELSACATPVVSGYSAAIRRTFGELVPTCEAADETTEALQELFDDSDLRDRRGHLAMRKVLSAHTYRDRVDDVLEALGLKSSTLDRSVSVVVPTNRPHQLDHAIAQVAHQIHRPLQLVLVLHGIPDVGAKEKAFEAGIEDVAVVTADSSLTLGECLNRGLDAADGNYIAKMDDDNLYGPNYLSDLLFPFTYTDASIVGKCAHYVHLTSKDATILRFPEREHKLSTLIQGGTILADAEVLRRLRFSRLPRGVDTDLLRRAQTNDMAIYSADRFNFVSVRSQDPHDHTWQITDDELARSGAIAFEGSAEENVFL